MIFKKKMSKIPKKNFKKNKLSEFVFKIENLKFKKKIFF
jgi:hypothetical protein